MKSRYLFEDCATDGRNHFGMYSHRPFKLYSDFSNEFQKYTSPVTLGGGIIIPTSKNQPYSN